MISKNTTTTPDTHSISDLRPKVIEPSQVLARKQQDLMMQNAHMDNAQLDIDDYNLEEMVNLDKQVGSDKVSETPLREQSMLKEEYRTPSKSSPLKKQSHLSSSHDEQLYTPSDSFYTDDQAPSEIYQDDQIQRSEKYHLHNFGSLETIDEKSKSELEQSESECQS